MTTRQDGRIITFYSYKGGTGRTMALANVAWILAANGKRVLAVDWDLEAPGLDRYFQPFLDPSVLTSTTGIIDMITEYCWAATTGTARTGSWHREYAHAEEHAVSLSPERFGLSFPEGGSLDFLSAGRQNRHYPAAVTSFDWDNFYERLGGGHFLDALREDMKASYDYVLIDSRTGLSDTADICTIQMPDVLVDCFTLSGQSLDGAAAVARSVEGGRHKRRIRVLPVLMRIDEGEKRKVDAGRALARLRFEGLPRGIDGAELNAEQRDAYWGSMEIPYVPFYAYEETLATVGDRGSIANSLLSAFERLTKAISDGDVTGLPVVPEPIRQRCLEAFARRQPLADVLVVFAPENRMWADWVENVLQQTGCKVILHDISAGPPQRPESTTRALLLLSHAFQNSPHALTAWRCLVDGSPVHRTNTVSLRVDEVHHPDATTDHESVDLYRLDAGQGITALLGALKLPERPADLTTVEPRFPGSAPSLWNAPQRNVTFTGRGQPLAELREQLRGGPPVVGTRPITLFGLGGVGKTQVALEYVHRFMADYDLVWWISAEHGDAITAALAELGARIGAPGGEDMTLVSQETVRMLAEEVPPKRWILIFDNADNPEEVTPFFPQGGGDILVTSRNQAWGQRGPSLFIDVFPRRESVEHLSLRAPGLSAEEADSVAVAVGDLPLAVEQAAAWLAEAAPPIEEYLRQLNEQTTGVLDLSQPADYPATVAATWNISIAQLWECSPASVRLLQLCAFMAPEPISSRLLYSREMLEELKKVDPSLQEGLMLGRVIREIGRFALAKIDQASTSIQVHRLVQAVIRSQLTEEERQHARHVVHTILAGARPPGDEPIDATETWPRFAIIWPHLNACELRDCHEPEPRRLLIDRVRYLWKRGDFPGARKLAEDLGKHWHQTLGEDDLQYMYLRGQLANVFRSQGRYAEAREVDADVLTRQQRVLGPTHPHAFVTTSSLASDLAALGEYTEAVKLAREAHQGFRRIFDESHGRTLNAANNLALTLRMIGRYDEARDIDQDTYARRREVLGHEHPYTLLSAQGLGRDLREVGCYTDSVAVLTEAYAVHKRVLGDDFPATLNCAKSLAVSLRRVGRSEEAHRLTLATLSRYQTQYTRDKYPDPIPDHLACELNLAADLYTADEPDRARETVDRVLEHYVQVAGENHPYTQAARNNLGIYIWACGDAEESEAVFQLVTERMAATLGPEHPHTLFARANHSNVLAEQGREAEAWALEEPTRDSLKAVLGPQHPETLAVISNSALTLRALGREEEARPLRESVLSDLRRIGTKLGEHNGITRLVTQRRRTYRDIEPLAV